MNIGPVYWGSHPGGTLEKVMAVLVAQDHPGTMRRTPSRGDGGVDLMVPDGDGWHIRQVKGFTGRVGSGRRKQIEKSYRTFAKDPRLKRPVTRWTLTAPIDITSEEQDWFEELTESSSFPCDWDGEVFWHMMASRHPYVIDYYLRDGRQRVEARSQLLLGSTTSAAGPLTANDVAGHLELLRGALNREDPHYRYEFVTGPAASEENSAPEGCVMAVTLEAEASPLMIQVFPKHLYALEDAPIEGTMNITLFDPGRDIDIREQFESFRMYGSAVELPEGSLDGEFLAPGGLGGEIKGGSGRIGPNVVSDPPEKTRIRLVHPEDGPIIEVGLNTQAVTRGELRGVELTATDESGILTATFRIHPPGSQEPLTFHLNGTGLAGRAIQEAIPAVRLLGSFRPPVRFEWLAQFGNQVLAAQTIDEDHALLTEGEVALFEDLGVIQDHVRETVVIPDELPAEAVQVIRSTAHLIRNRELTGTWSKLDVNLKEGVRREDVMAKVTGESSLAAVQDQTLQLGDSKYELGSVHYVYATARLADTQPTDKTILRFVPGADNEMRQGLGALPTNS